MKKQRRAEIDRVCEKCGVSFKAWRCKVIKGHARYCSVECQRSDRRGANNPKWRGGKVRMGTDGYVRSYAPEHPHATRAGYVMEHRLVMEAKIGRLLTAEEQVHHINHVKNDNRPENLELMASAAVHRERHGYFEECACGECGATVRRSLWHRRNFARKFCSRKCAAAFGSRCASEKARAA